MVTTRIALDGALTIAGADSALAAIIRADNTYPNPAFQEARRQGRYAEHLPSTIATYREFGDTLILPRGYLGDLLQERPALLSALTDHRTESVVDFPVLGAVLRGYQETAMASAIKREQGVIQAPTGAGKTLIGLELIRRRSQRALVLVHNNELARQWSGAIERFMGFTPGVIGDGKWKEGDRITVATLQTLHRNQERVSESAENYGLVLTDECHHIPSRTFADVMLGLPCRYRYGLSATIHRRDGLHQLINRVIGRTIAQISPEEVEDVGGIVPAQIKVVPTGFEPCDVDGWTELLDKIVQSPDRNRVVADWASRAAGYAPTLVLVDRIDHAESLARLCSVPALVAHGQLSKKERKRVFEAMPDAPLTIGTTGLLGEGLDISRWSVLVLATPISGRVKLLQAIGRIIRPHPGKKNGLVIDLVDQHAIALACFRKRREIYVERGYWREAA
ncbi:MAG: hypothetical protein A2286_06070 [Gammaproteobacteria bacterium RIFOXYA12_FULL_61_12]|nr:MAG: hypothetical protein A2514_15965 [Gammaproteobacteria bacterium RIFOXYD12_FULL_61_37]OGT94581.1 MAG: hypothetical protein A2286_06070 [Gammaproteobacteria bacterium RIFOXYA12_FULL_61_12]